MEKELNIAAILKGKPVGIKLWSSVFGDCTLDKITSEDSLIWTYNTDRVLEMFFYPNGKYDRHGECVIFPSKQMQDWSKFAWKKGDVLVSNNYGTEVIFYDWCDDTYTNFYGKHYLNSKDKNNIKYNDTILCITARYSIEDKDAAQTYINIIEERLGGKLNLETLEIEKKPEKKKVINLKQKWTPKPFDKIVVFEELSEEWVCDMFSHYSKNYEDKEIIVTIGGCTYFKALPFNEKTAKLIGTSDDWEG